MVQFSRSCINSTHSVSQLLEAPISAAGSFRGGGAEPFDTVVSKNMNTAGYTGEAHFQARQLLFNTVLSWASSKNKKYCLGQETKNMNTAG